MRNPLRDFNSTPELIRLTVIMRIRWPLSLRRVEDHLFERGIDNCHETGAHENARRGPRKSGSVIADFLRPGLQPLGP